MVFDGRWIGDDFDIVHLDAFTVTEFLVLDEGDEFHHLAMRLDLSHVFLDGQLFASE